MPNALAALYSYGDGLKRKMNRLISDPAGTIDLGARRFNEDQNALQNLFANAFPMGGDKTVLNSPQQVAQFQGEATDKALETYGGLMGATVWHGSPHKFSKFDGGKIGTGEGAQAYGHGIYTAEDRGIADVYRRKLTGVDGAPVAHPDQSLQVKIGRLEDQIRQLQQSGDASAPAMIKAYQSRIAELDGGGSLYKVDLPDEHIAKMLDWDKPLSQQPRNVRKALGPNVVQRDGGWYVDSGPNKSTWRFSSKNEALSEMRQARMSRDRTGNALHDSVKTGADAETAQTLRNLGIPGIRYLDGGSRGAGGGTSNYVMFPGNEGLLQILERNGQAIK
jgi:hypothetical protein